MYMEIVSKLSISILNRHDLFQTWFFEKDYLIKQTIKQVKLTLLVYLFV